MGFERRLGGVGKGRIPHCAQVRAAIPGVRPRENIINYFCFEKFLKLVAQVSNLCI
jgi:hypothetical protein